MSHTYYLSTNRENTMGPSSYFKLGSTNELPLSSIDFSTSLLSPEILQYDPITDVSYLLLKQDGANKETRLRISPLATNERPLSCTCLASFVADETSSLLKPKCLSKKNGIDFFERNITHLYSVSDPTPVKRRYSLHDRPLISLDHLDHLDPFDCVKHPTIRVTLCDTNTDSLNNLLILDDCCSSRSLLTGECGDQASCTELTSQSQINKQTIYTTDTCHQDPTDNYFVASFQANKQIASTATTVCTTNNNPTTKPHPKLVQLQNPDHTMTTATSSSPPSSGGSVTCTEAGGAAGSAASSSSATHGGTSRRQRHSIAGQMSYYKMLGFGGFGKKMAASTNSLFSTAVISGSSSAPNLRDMIPSTATPSVLEGFGGVPPIRPLETLHNALSLKQLDAFLEKMTTAPLFKTPASSPPKYPSTPVATPVQTPQNSVPDRSVQLPSWSGQSSMTSSMGCMSSEGPSSPIFSDAYSRGGGCPSSEMSASIASSDGAGFFAAAASSELSQMYPTLDDLGTIDSRFALDQFTVQASHGSANQSIGDTTHSDITPMSACSDCWEFNTNDATRGSTANEMLTEEEDEDATLSTDTCFSGLSDISKQVSVPTIPLNNTTIDTDSHPNASAPSGSVSKEIVFDFKNISNNIATKNNAENVKKVDNRARNTCIQKQISLYEKDCTTEYRNLALDLNKFMATPCNLEAPQCQNNGCSTSAAGATQVDLKFISADDLDKTITNVKQNLSAISFLESAANDKCPKTKACANLKVTPVPGAVMVRELFIEAPRMHATATSGQQPGQYNQRMTLSQSSGFMGRHSITEMEPSTSFPSVNASGAKRLNTFHRQSSVSGTSSSRPRFTTTKVCESELKDQPHMGQESREEYNQSDGVGGDTQQKKNDNN